jgi:hypothetical protein
MLSRELHGSEADHSIFDGINLVSAEASATGDGKQERC